MAPQGRWQAAPLYLLRVSPGPGTQCHCPQPTTTQASAGPSVAKCRSRVSAASPSLRMVPSPPLSSCLGGGICVPSPKTCSLSPLSWQNADPWPPCLPRPPPTYTHTGQSPGHHRCPLRRPVLLSQPPTSALATRPGWGWGGPSGRCQPDAACAGLALVPFLSQVGPLISHSDPTGPGVWTTLQRSGD